MKHQKVMRAFSLGLLGILLTLNACAPKASTPSPDMIRTNVAQTVAVEFTKTAIARPTETPTPQPTPTFTALPPTATVPTASITRTATTPSASQPAAGGTDGGVWARSEPADGATIAAGSTFNVVVTLLNTGTSTWTTDYGIRFMDGKQMGAPDLIKMPYTVPPQMTAQITMKFTAPSTAGDVRSDWSIVNANGNAFGYFWFEYKIN